MIKLTFLGTGGGRFATLFQTRATGGIYLEDFSSEKPYRVHIDPGPGALVHAGKNGVDPTRTDAIIVTHCHPDHYVDVEILTEAMTMGGRRKRGLLLGSRSTLEGVENIGPCVSKYFQKNVEKCVVMEKDSVKLGELVVTPGPSIHSDPTTVGLKFSTNLGGIFYVSDTEYSMEIADAYRNARVLILPVTRPRAAKIPYHLTTDDAAKFVSIVKPELCIFTHFGLKMIEADPDAEARWVEQQSNVKCIAAKDGMKIEIDE